MGALRIHGVVYLAINAMLVAIWAITGGAGTFWPIWPLITWGSALAIHGGIAAVTCRPRRELAPGPVGGRPLDRPAPKEIGGHRRKWVAAMFVDIVDSTRLNEQLGDEEWHGVLAFHRARVRAAVSAWDGIEVGTAGDGTLARFDSPVDAVRCAVDIQRLIDDSADDDELAPTVRIGIHAGEVLQSEEDLLGRVVNLASRVGGQADESEILVTETVADELGPEIAVEDRGLRPLKGLDRPRHLLAVVWSEGRDRRPTTA